MEEVYYEGGCGPVVRGYGLSSSPSGMRGSEAGASTAQELMLRSLLDKVYLIIMSDRLAEEQNLVLVAVREDGPRLQLRDFAQTGCQQRVRAGQLNISH